MKKLCMLLFLMMVPAAAWSGEWLLDGNRSDVNFVSVKKESVAEVHHFNGLSGVIQEHHAEIAIDLSSIESGIAIRNQRMQSMLFEVSRFASAKISVDLSGVNYEALKVGESVTLQLPLLLDLHGIKRPVVADVQLIAVADGLLVTSRQPVIVKAAEFGLDGGIEALRQIASLPSIAHAVPVFFHLQFIRSR
ncbi:YceI family protein [Mariprofundus sp. KV]|uniref:YceI family protein n=1 Tax=Mariprofundus sp. KV TaxID=2608715 RepID=UPI0015A4E299|nr:YceI family protein [Mariprofundus sp. KV]NWF35192.1 YceI family protein [Mariprofundus sp. KV]